jgi:peptide/nickel transport system permease protein
MGIRYRLEEFKAGLGPAKKELTFTLRRIKKSPLSIVGIAIVIFFTTVAILAPIIAPPVTADPFRIWRDGFGSIPKPPGTPVEEPVAREVGWTVHFFGTAEGQFDIFYGCIWGTITAFRVGILVVAISLIIGLLFGSAAGYFGGATDELLMRFTDVILAFPGLILAMALVIALPAEWPIDLGFFSILILVFILPTIVSRPLKLKGGLSLWIGLLCLLAFLVVDVGLLGSPSIWSVPLYLSQLDKVLIALALVGWPGYTRVIRGEFLRVKQEDYVEAAKAVGCSDFRIIMRHILPNAIYPVIIMASLDIGSIVLTAAALSFLGIGAPVGYADWGQMISFARNWIYAGFQNPWQYWYTFTIPGLFIFIFVLGWNLLGDAFRDILDPTLRRK